MGERKVLNKVRQHVSLRVTACSCPCVGAKCHAAALWACSGNQIGWHLCQWLCMHQPAVLMIAVLPAGLRSGEAAPGAARQQRCADEGKDAYLRALLQSWCAARCFLADVRTCQLASAADTCVLAVQVRMMLAMSVRCSTCGNYMYKGTKFTMRMEVSTFY